MSASLVLVTTPVDDSAAPASKVAAAVPAMTSADEKLAPAVSSAGHPQPAVLAVPKGDAVPPRLTFAKSMRRYPPWVSAVLAPVLGFGLMLIIWAVIAQKTGSIPGPLKTWEAARVLFADPFYRNGPNDQGIGWNILSSLQRVGIGFGIAAAVGIPLGFLLGRFTFFARMFEPIISLLRPVSPLAWLPIGLLVFKRADPAATWTIFICSIWPMILNTAQGVQRVPQDYLNVARVLGLPESKIISKILLPAALPYILTGIRLSIGTAWLVIVAAEMLTGGVGIGFWVWDEWNNLKVEHIVIAIFVIGIVGLLLEQMLILLAKRLSHE